ncbi:TlpA family protein disulfide reductase [Flavobacterium sp. CYK-4]|uniref:TlpA family protein disulfide reductase n=1 Tax=Flavobacterium lotistagni TaxID=2709660 RepID=UPI0014075040|nr:TlpA disulfide reductase family protein [Flavobacterium lotistagni]NHM05958.1 TlpA family protein disulfide reductase [Flavobacterium lotistagni]
MKKLLLLFVVLCSLSVFSQGKPKTAKPKAKPNDAAFRIQILGKLLEECPKPPDVTFGDFHGSDTDVQAMNVNAKGEFSASYMLKEPGLFYFKKGGYTEYFMVSPKETLYKIELGCSKNVLAPVKVIGSTENKAYQQYLALREQLNKDLEVYKDKDLSEDLLFQGFANQWRDYQKNLVQFIKQYPQTYTARQIASFDRLAEKDLESLETLGANYLQRAVFGDQKFYNSPLPSYLLEDYLHFIDGKKKASFAPFENLLTIASKNPTAAKRLQHVLFEAFSKNKRQDLINGYINWYKAHPSQMLHTVVQAKLDMLAKSMVGAPFTNMKLNDVQGKAQELQPIVESSNYTLLTFFSPGCSHCQETLPKLIPIGEQYKNKGLKIYTVAAKTADADWTAFLTKYTSPEWTNVMDEPTNRHFGEHSVNSLPYFILIDNKGKIVSRMDAKSVLTELPKWFQ